jgi:hypothetical protein
MRRRTGRSGIGKAASGAAAACRALVAALATAALLLTLVLPGHAAPDRGLRAVTLCTGNGLETVTIDADGRRVPPHGQQQPADHDCLACCLRLPAAALPVPSSAAAPSPAREPIAAPPATAPWTPAAVVPAAARAPPPVG